MPREPDAASDNPTPANRLNEIKAAFLSHKSIAWAVLLFIILAAIISLISQTGSIISLGETLFPRTVLLIRAVDTAYVTIDESTATIELDFILDSKKTLITEDISLTLKFFIFEKDKDGYKPLSDQEALSIFVVDSKVLQVSPVDTKASRVSHKLLLGCQRSGHYLVTIIANSQKKDLRAEATVKLDVLPRYVKCLMEHARYAGSPVFILLKDDVIDVRPRRFGDSGAFKILLPDEAERTNPVKASLWLAPDYVGTAGGPILQVYRDVSPYDIIQNGTPDVCDGARYIPHLLKNIRDIKNLEDIAVVEQRGESTIVPIGNSVYRLQLIDSQRLKIWNVEKDVCTRVTVTMVNETDNGTKEWHIASHSLNALSGYNAGATGRNVTSWIKVGNYSGSEFDSIEGLPEDSDFPLVIPISSTGYGKSHFLLIDNPDSLSVRECKDSH